MASKTTGVAPPDARFQPSIAVSTAGSTTAVAPMDAASARRRGEKSLATICSMPFDRNTAINARPIGPAPKTSAPSPRLILDLLTACTATATGSVSAAVRASNPFGTGKHIPAVSCIRSANAPT